MEDRYEIKSKIGQGGFGSVYRAFDKRMNREVAIKRINSSDEDGMLEEASRQLSKEAGALASLQHPNIITIYDVGNDDEGPYVVMELLSGSALDDIVEKAPLTWEDFRELAMQSQEALIGAQELELVHRDIKPANVMLTWLPSGKFQVKLLDFGLAKLTQRPSLQTLNQSESIFGSIFFMSPEQFERAPLDRRTDMYAMGCVYYYSLTGAHPFNGATAVEVMSAHLHHDFVPLNEVRPDLPGWVCDWVMWHMNRYPDDRPASAREALQVFVQNDKNPPAENATGAVQPAKRPKLLIPGAEPLVPGEMPEPKSVPQTGSVKPITKTAPQPLMPPSGSKPSVHSTRQQEVEASDVPAGAGEDAPVVPPPGDPAPPTIQPAKKNLTTAQRQPTIGKPSGGPKLLTGAQTASAATTSPPPNPATASHSALSQPSAGSQALGGAGDPTRSHRVPGVNLPNKKKGNNALKMAVAAVLAILVLISGWMLMNRSQQNREREEYNRIVALAADPEVESIGMPGASLQMLLRSAMSIRENEARETVYRALFLAEATDATDVDAEIVRFATEQQMMESVRNVLFLQVLRRRGNPQIVTPLLDFAASTDNDGAAVSALQAVRRLVSDEHFDRLLNTLQFTTNAEARRAAEEAIVHIIEQSSNRGQYSSRLRGVFNSSVNDDARHAALRLLGRVADENALEIVRGVLVEGDEDKDKIAALSALAAWRTPDGFPVVISFINQTDSDSLRLRAFESALRHAARLDEVRADSDERRAVWTQIANTARSSDEQERVVQRLAINHRDEWVLPLIQPFTAETNSDRVIDMAERAIRSIETRRQAGGGEGEEG